MESAGKSAKESGNIARHTIIYAIGNVTRQLVGFLMLPVYTRYLSPADYGAVGLLTFALALLEPFFGARMTQAVPRFYFASKDENSRRAVITSALTLTASISALTALAIWFMREPASELLFGTTEYALATALFGLNILTQPVEYSGMMFIRLQQRSILFLVISLAKMVVQIALNVLLVIYWEMGVVGVILSGVIASTLFGIGLTGYVIYYNRPRFDGAIAWKMLMFSWPLWFAGLAGLYIGSSNRLYLRIFDSLDSVGLLELGTKFASIIGLLIWTPFSQHWETVSYKYHSQENAASIFQTAYLIIGALLVICGLGVSVFSEPLIILMSSEGFHAASKTVPLLTLGFIFQSMATFFYFSFMVTDNTKIFTYCHYLTAVIITFCYLALIPVLGEIGAAGGQCLAYAINFVIAYYLSRRYYDPGIKLPPLFILAAIATGSYIISNIFIDHGTWQFDLAMKSIIYLSTCCLIAAVSLHMLRSSNPELYRVLIRWLDEQRNKYLPGRRAETQ